MGYEKHIAVAIKNLANQFHRYMTALKLELAASADDFEHVTDIQVRIISYLYERLEREAVYQRDIEKHFSIRRSTATNILKRIERNGLIKRATSDADARMKTIVLTGRAKRLYPKARAEILKVEQQAAKGLTDVELALFFRIIETMSKNIT